ncbi:MAG TPA: 1-deoxy-D-xylulose-5-phosphate reductoisomerase [bacterium]|nr:1-deoxy-D-xylulose-5-phosphate reductoisomerase [bacterium]
MKRIIILGSTGSIGRQALEIVDAAPGDFQVAGLGARRDAETLTAQARKYKPTMVAIADPDAANVARTRLSNLTEILSGPNALQDLVSKTDADLVLVAVVGIAGLRPTLAALKSGREVALANKETLVAGGAAVTEELHRHGSLLPVDSEHSAIAQCLRGERADSVRRIILTSSGGSLLRRPLETMDQVRIDEALAHPNWKMGKKITVDSATLMNKGLEVIEAHWLFGLTPDQIDVIIHPQSIVHSMVEFVDGSVKAQLGRPDMKTFIAYALYGGERPALPSTPLEWARVQLSFERPDPQRFPALGYAYEALRSGGTMPAVMNAANEVAVQLFLEGRIKFPDIPRIVRTAMDAHKAIAGPSVEQILDADVWAREYTNYVRSDIVA